MRRSPFVWLPLSCVALVGCVSAATVGGSSNGPDGGDAAIEDDASPAPDAMTPPDVTVAPDMMVPPDAEAPPDAVVAPDVAAPPDVSEECGAPALETCNGLDDDCNGRVDDIASGACSPGPCATGRLACVAGAERCVTDTLRPATAVCRAAAGPCDAIERCTGTSEACPADALLPAGARAYERTPSTLPFIDACGAPGAQRILRGTDDGVMPLTLPFTFPFYGIPRGDANVSSNGLLTFGPPTVEAAFTNEALPDARFPAAVFAYFDDVMTRSTGVCVATVGTAPDRRFVVQWADAHYCCTDDPGVHLSFEVVLSEASGVVDVRYDRMESAAEPGRASGDGATAGIQDGLGRLHDLVGFNRAGTVASGVGFRWTPTAGAICRPSAAACDPPEYCDGARSTCPAEVRLPVGTACGGGLVCGAGAECCVGGPSGCDACPGRGAEVCNGLDDDCDGMADEGLTRACYIGSSGTAGVGICRNGSQTCLAGAWGATCPGEVLPRAETCNALDDNCDGTVDDGVCP